MVHDDGTVVDSIRSIGRHIDVLDNFLDLGGHSLLVMRAVAMLESRTGRRVSPRAFIFQMLEQLARDYDALKLEDPTPARPAKLEEPAPPPGLLRRVQSVLTTTRT